MIMWLTIIEGVSVCVLSASIFWAVRQVKSHRCKHEQIEQSQIRQEQFNMLQLHYRAKNSGMTLHEKTLFYNTYDAYKEKGYNSFIDDIKKDIDDL